MHFVQILEWLLSFPAAEWGVQHIKELVIGALRQGPIPRHVAFVMDGNRRFARNRKIETVEGHNLGFEALARILEVCYKCGVKVVTIYAFSIENFKRSKYEVDALMEMAKTKLVQLSQHGALLDHYGAAIRILGQRELVKPDVIEAIDQAVNLTSKNRKAILNVCFPYTSRDEITTAIRSTVSAYSQPLPPSQRFSESHITHTLLSTTTNPASLSPALSAIESRDPSPGSSPTLRPDSPSPTQAPISHSAGASITLPDPETITDAVLDEHMFTAGSPPLDLLVRTSGVERLSDFMLWQCHQRTQIVFLECLWPEFDLWHFLPVLVEWQWRRRKEVQEGAGPMWRRGRARVKAQ